MAAALVAILSSPIIQSAFITSKAVWLGSLCHNVEPYSSNGGWLILCNWLASAVSFQKVA